MLQFNAKSLVAVVLLGLILTALSGPAAAATVRGEHCTVQYSGIDAAYAQAMATVYDTAHAGYRDTLALKLPERVIIKVTTGAYATRLWTDGAGFIYLELADSADLEPGRGYFHIYGICRQMGLITMYSRLSTLAGLPEGVGMGWGHYCGSLVTDYVWGKLGRGAWPVPYDYNVNGTARLRSQCEQPGSDPMLTAACTFLAIGDKYTHKKAGTVMKGALANEPAGHELMGRFAKILDARAEAGASDLIPGSVRKSPITTSDSEIIMLPSHIAADTEAWTDEDGWMGYDDDYEDGMRSQAGSGHAVRFHVKRGGELTKVMLKGARYGMPQSDSKFRMTVLDGGYEVLQMWELPYMKFSKRGEPLYWVEFDTLGLEVPEDFYVVFDFNPHATNGVYVGYDADTSSHSYSGLQYERLREFHEGDWMIRVKVE